MATIGRHAFDFLYGTWTYRLRKLRDTTDPQCTEWQEFTATGEASPILGGLGNVDRLYVPATDQGEAFEGFTLRLYDPGSDSWRIWWASTRAPGVFDDPVVGRFDAGLGIFECDDVVGGQSVRVRYTWFSDDVEPRFEQAFSRDAGRSWQTNWITTQRRAPTTR
jgi:hypothetical protein